MLGTAPEMNLSHDVFRYSGNSSPHLLSIPKLVQILQTTSPFNWRLREVLAQQLPDLAPLLTLDSVFFSVVPVAFGLLNDPVAVVRQKTFEVSPWERKVLP